MLLWRGVQAVHAVARRGEGGGGDLDGEQEGDPHLRDDGSDNAGMNVAVYAPSHPLAESARASCVS